jgi:hypothetical protein
MQANKHSKVTAPVLTQVTKSNFFRFYSADINYENLQVERLHLRLGIGVESECA